MATAAALDPYYYTRNLQALEAQRQSTGQSKGFDPSQLSQMIYANFQAQQERETTERKLAIAERSQTLEEQNAAEQRKQAQISNIAGGALGLTQIGMNLPGAIKGYQDVGWMKKPGQTQAITPTAATTTDTTGMALTPTTAGTTIPSYLSATGPAYSEAGLATGESALTGVGVPQTTITGAETAGSAGFGAYAAPLAGGFGAYGMGKKMGLTDTQAIMLGAAGIGLSIAAPWAGAAILGADLVSGWF